MKWLKILFVAFSCGLLAACGFHLQGVKPLAAPLHNMYVQSPDPYGHLARDLEQELKLSNVHLATDAHAANVILAILKDDNSQEMLSVSGTQQTRQYRLTVSVQFEITDKNGRQLLSPQTLQESRIITIQSNQILGSSNESQLFYQQMRATLAYAIVNRIASPDVTRMVNEMYGRQQGHKKS